MAKEMSVLKIITSVKETPWPKLVDTLCYLQKEELGVLGTVLKANWIP